MRPFDADPGTDDTYCDNHSASPHRDTDPACDCEDCMATMPTDRVTVYTFSVTVTVPMDNDQDGTPDYPVYTAEEIGKMISAGLRRVDGDTDYELMDTEVRDS
jgi:hypothetical protein